MLLQNVLQPLLRTPNAHPLDRVAGGGSLAVAIAGMFVNGERGGDFLTANKLTNFFSDAAGTVPASVNGQVAAVRSNAGDISMVTQPTAADRPLLRGTPQGPNLALADGSFFNIANWTPPAGCTITDGVATFTACTGVLPCGALVAVNGKVYKTQFYATRSAGTIAASFGGVTGVARAVTGAFIDYLPASGAGAFQYELVGFTGTAYLLQIWAADASDVAQPYSLDFDGVSDFMSAPNTIAGYPATIVSKARSAGASGIEAPQAIYQGDADAKYIDLLSATRVIDWGTGTIIGSGGLTDSIGDTQVAAAEFTSSLITMTNQSHPGTPVANTNAFGTKTSYFRGKSRATAFYLGGQNMGDLAISRVITAAEALNIERYTNADGCLQCWGNSMTAGSGVSITSGWPLRFRRQTLLSIDNRGVGGETSAQIRARFEAYSGPKRRWINTFWMAENDNYNLNGWGPTKANMAACIALLEGRQRFLVFGSSMRDDFTSSVTAAGLNLLNADLLALYGNRFVDWRAYLQSKHDGTANDLADIAAGLVPRSLRSDEIHLNDRGYQLVNELIQARIVAQGWHLWGV